MNILALVNLDPVPTHVPYLRMCQALWLRHSVACMSTVHGAHTAVRYEIFTFSLEFPYKKIPMSTGIIYSCKLGSSPSLNHWYSLNSSQNIVLYNFSLLNLAFGKMTPTAAAATRRQFFCPGQAHLPTHAGTKYPVRGNPSL